MTFIIRRITKRPAGQDIVRDSEVNAKKLTVGRATNNDLFLSDLQVGLNHLTISQSGSRLAIRANRDKKFLLNGRLADQATVSSNGRDEIQVGPFGLTFDRDSQGRWVIIVERVESEDSLDVGEVDDLFTLRGTFLSKRGAAWVGSILALIIFLAFPVAWFVGSVPDSANDVLDADRPWLSGELSGGHANLEAECESCHKKAFEHVTNATCIDCHNDLINHADPMRLTLAMSPPTGFDGVLLEAASFFGKERGDCADCHREHNGEDGVILSNSVLCTDCHLGMSARLTDTKLQDAGDFGSDHPNFSATVIAEPGRQPTYVRLPLNDPELKDNSGLKFPHDLHLLADGGVAQQARALGADYGFGDALTCEDCHTLDKAGLTFETVTMEADCQMCHSLVFETDGTAERKLPHGQPREVINVLREYYRARALGQAIAPTSTGRRRPGETTVIREADRSSTAVVDADQNANLMIERVFNPGGSCFDCHEVIPAPPGTVDYDILPVTLVDQFMTKARFNHAKHEVGDLTCESCHAARGSDLSSHVLLPGIDTRVSALTGEEVVGCHDCHGGEKAGGNMVASTCVDCHGYHDGTHAPVMTAARAFDPGQWRRISSGDGVR